MKIIVGFSKSKKKFAIASWLLQLYMRAAFSHIYIRLPWKEEKGWTSDKIVHASEGLVQHMSGTNFDIKHKVVEEFCITITKEQWKEFKMKDFHEPSGADYSILQNIGIFIVDLLSLIGIKATNPWKKGWNCSEYVLTLLQKIYPNKYSHLRPNLVSPKDIYVILKKQNKGKTPQC